MSDFYSKINNKLFKKFAQNFSTTNIRWKFKAGYRAHGLTRFVPTWLKVIKYHLFLKNSFRDLTNQPSQGKWKWHYSKVFFLYYLAFKEYSVGQEHFSLKIFFVSLGKGKLFPTVWWSRMNSGSINWRSIYSSYVLHMTSFQSSWLIPSS